jgi:hypothetical protein
MAANQPAIFSPAKWISQNKHFDELHLPNYIINAFDLVMTILLNPYSKVLDPNATSGSNWDFLMY